MAGRKGNGKSRPNGGKSPPKQPALFEVGGPQGPGRGPRKGTGGRPRNEFRARMRELAEHSIPEDILQVLPVETLQLIASKYPEQFLRLMELRRRTWCDVADRGYGKPVQPIRAAPEEAEEIEALAEMSDQELWEYHNALRKRAAQEAHRN